MTQLEAKLEQRIAEVRAELRATTAALEARLESRIDTGLANQRAELLRWMFVFWAGTVIPLAGLILALNRL